LINKNLLYTLLFVFIPNILCACAVCYGSPDDPITQSLNTAMLFMLGIVFFVLSCIVYSIFILIKRSSNIQT